MHLSYQINRKFAIAFARNTFSLKTGTVGYDLKVEFTPPFGLDGDLIPLGEMESVVDYVADLFNNATFMSVDDPYVNNYIEPKNGDTKQQFMERLVIRMKELNRTSYYIGGAETPPNTFDRGKVIFTTDAACLESLANSVMEFIQRTASEQIKFKLITTISLIQANGSGVVLSDDPTAKQLALDL